VPTPLTGFGRAAPLAIAASTLLVAVVAPATPAAADADLRILGGNASAAVVCGNVAAASDLAHQRGIPIQRNNCSAKGTGGDVTLQDVDIFVSSSAAALNRGNPVLAALAAATPPDIAQDKCDNHRPGPGPGKQLNKCFTLARSGVVKLNNVTQVVRHSDGRTTTRTIESAALPPGNSGTASAVCTNVVNDPLNQRDDCNGNATGGFWTMRGVDVVEHHPDGSTSTRHRVTVDVRGGTANANVFCFNVTDGSGRVIQINVCDSNAKGGDATLHNVTFHTSA